MKLETSARGLLYLPCIKSLKRKWEEELLLQEEVFMRWEVGEELLSLQFFFRRERRPQLISELMARILFPGRPFTPLVTFSALLEGEGEVHEMLVALNEGEREQIEKLLPLFHDSLREALRSPFRAQLLLERGGEEKGALAERLIQRLIRRFPDQFGSDLFQELQRLHSTAPDSFKSAASARKVARLAALFYFFRHQKEKSIHLRISRERASHPLGDRERLCIVVSLMLSSREELFDETHLLRALMTFHSDIQETCAFHWQSERVQLLYMEVEREGGLPFSSALIQEMKQGLPQVISTHVEKLVHPYILPRNDEEMLRHLMTLSLEVRYPRDLPHLILTFDGQSGDDLLFSAVLVRSREDEDPTLETLLERRPPSFQITVERVRSLGKLHKTREKEGYLLRLQLPAQNFLRGELLLDLFQAREEAVIAIEKLVGEVRDFNGGMFQRQKELLERIKREVGTLSERETILLEALFHAIYPLEMRTTVQPGSIKQLFELFLRLEAAPEERLLSERAEGALFVVLRGEEEEWLKELHLVPGKLLRTRTAGSSGFILFGDDGELDGSFLEALAGAHLEGDR